MLMYGACRYISITEQPQVPGTEYNMDPKPDFGEESYVGSNKLQGKVALITGGDSGIGRAVAWAFAKEGADIAFTYVPMEQKDADEVTKVITTKTSQKCLAIAADFTKPSDATMIVDETMKRFGKIDVLVLNAAKQDKKVDDFTADDGFTYERVNTTFQVNIISMFMTCKEAMKIMKPGSSIITTASTNAYSPMDVVLDYSVTKGAIRTFTQGLSSAAIKKGIRVNCVAPGPIWTPIQPGSFPPTMVAQMGSSTPMERAGQPVEVAPAYVYFADNKMSSYTNGMILGVTGGMLLA